MERVVVGPGSDGLPGHTTDREYADGGPRDANSHPTHGQSDAGTDRYRDGNYSHYRNTNRYTDASAHRDYDTNTDRDAGADHVDRPALPDDL